jgi:hypothetical protein
VPVADEALDVPEMETDADDGPHSPFSQSRMTNNPISALGLGVMLCLEIKEISGG